MSMYDTLYEWGGIKKNPEMVWNCENIGKIIFFKDLGSISRGPFGDNLFLFINLRWTKLYVSLFFQNFCNWHSPKSPDQHHHWRFINNINNIHNTNNIDNTWSNIIDNTNKMNNNISFSIKFWTIILIRVTLLVEVIGGRAVQRGTHPSRMYLVSTKTGGENIDRRCIVKPIINVISQYHEISGIEPSIWTKLLSLISLLKRIIKWWDPERVKAFYANV